MNGETKCACGKPAYKRLLCGAVVCIVCIVTHRDVCAACKRAYGDVLDDF